MHALGRCFGIRVHYVQVGADRNDLLDPEPPVIPPGYAVRFGTKADFLPYVGKIEDLDSEFLEQAFERNDECSVAFYEGRLVSFCFCSRDRTRVTPQLDVLVPPGFRYLYKAWTEPGHRRKNLSTAQSWMRVTYGNRPFSERTLSYTETHNYPSLLTKYLHPNKRPLAMGLAGWITIFGRQIPINSRGARWIGFEFVRREDTRTRQYVV